jgi:hypothetical protein
MALFSHQINGPDSTPGAVAYPDWMFYGNRYDLLPNRFHKYLGLTPAKPWKPVKRRGKYYTISAPAITLQQDVSHAELLPEVIAWLDETVPGYKITKQTLYSTTNEHWWDECRIWFPSEDNIIQFRLAWE